MNSEENEKNLNNESNETEDKSTQKIENSDEYGNVLYFYFQKFEIFGFLDAKN